MRVKSRNLWGYDTDDTNDTDDEMTPMTPDKLDFWLPGKGRATDTDTTEDL